MKEKLEREEKGEAMKLSDILLNQEEFSRRVGECCSLISHEVDVNKGIKNAEDFESYLDKGGEVRTNWDPLFKAAEKFE